MRRETPLVSFLMCPFCVLRASSDSATGRCSAPCWSVLLRNSVHLLARWSSVACCRRRQAERVEPCFRLGLGTGRTEYPKRVCRAVAVSRLLGPAFGSLEKLPCRLARAWLRRRAV